MPGELPAPIEGQALIYATADGTVRVEVIYQDETFWLSQRRMAELFGVDVRTISEHLKGIYAGGELAEEPTIRKIRRVQREGSRDVSRSIDFYNLDAVISVGYRVNSRQATQFRIWATRTLKEFIVKGFVLDDERMDEALALVAAKQGADGRWRLQSAFNGRFVADIETKGEPSRWITLRALEVLRA